jgi:hypothetical protein
VSAFTILLIAKKQIENPTNNISKTLFMMMMLSGDVWVGKRCRNLRVME